MSLFVRLVGSRLPTLEVVFVRSVVTMLLTVALLLRQGGGDWLGERRMLLFLRGAFGFAALSCFYHSVTALPLAEATVIQFTSPIFTAVLAAVYLGERATPRLVVALVLGLAGIVILTRPAVLFGGTSPLPTGVVLVGLTGAFLTSCAYVLVRRLAPSENELVIIFYFPLVAVPASLASAVPVWVWPSAWEWLLLLAVGCAAQGGQLYLTRGMKHIQAFRGSVILYLQVLFAAVLGVLVLGERPGLWTVGGSLLVLGGSFIAARRPRLPA